MGILGAVFEFVAWVFFVALLAVTTLALLASIRKDIKTSGVLSKEAEKNEHC